MVNKQSIRSMYEQNRKKIQKLKRKQKKYDNQINKLTVRNIKKIAHKSSK